MLVEKAFEQVRPLVEILNAKDFCISPVENTPLAALVGASVSVNTAEVTLPSGSDGYSASMYSDSDAVGDTDNETHNKLFDDAVDFLSKTVAQHVSNAKNVVAPVVMSVAEKIIARVQSDITPLKTYAIVPVSLPAPMLNDGFKDTVVKAAGGIYADPERYIKLKQEFAPQAVLESMLTGSGDYDEKIKEWFASCGDAFFDKLWTSLFQDPSMNSVAESASLTKLLDDGKTGVDAALAVFLIARNLTENIPEDTGFTLVDYRKYVQQYKDTAAVRLNRAYESFDSEEKAGILVLSSDDANKEVRVHSQTYLSYIREGGKNEVLLGAIVSGVIPYNVAKLAENQQQFIDAWERHNLILSSESKNRAIVRFREICYSEFLNDLNNLTAFEQEFVQTNPGHVQKAQELGREICESLITEQIEKPYDVALSLVCNARFYYTDAEKILATINKVSEQNKSIDVREAALIATTEYLIDFVCEQLKVN